LRYSVYKWLLSNAVVKELEPLREYCFMETVFFKLAGLISKVNQNYRCSSSFCRSWRRPFHWTLHDSSWDHFLTLLVHKPVSLPYSGLLESFFSNQKLGVDESVFLNPPIILYVKISTTGPGQKLLTLVGSIFCCSGWVGTGQQSLLWVWVWKISPKNHKIFNFFLRFGSKMGGPPIYCGSKVCPGWVRSGPISALFISKPLSKRQFFFPINFETI